MNAPAWLYELLPNAVEEDVVLSASSVALTVGDWYCTDPADSSGNTVTKAVAAALTNAGGPRGICVEAAQPGATLKGRVDAYVPPGITGLGAGAVQSVKINTTTARSERTATPSSSDYLVGRADTAGGLTMDFELPGLTANVPVPANPADDGVMLYASAGAWVKTTTVEITNSGAALSFGSNPATASAINVINWSSDNRIAGKSSGGTTVALFHWTSGDRIAIGSSSVSILGADISTGTGTITFNIGGTFLASIGSSSLNLQFGGAALATTGTVRVCHGYSQYGRDFANSVSVPLFLWGVNANDRLDIGGAGVQTVVLNYSSAASLVISGSGVFEYVFTSTTLDGNQNTLTDWASISLGTSTAAGSLINLQNTTSLIELRNFANTGDLLVLSTSTDDTLRFGNDSGVAGIHLRTGTGALRGFVGGTEVLNISGTITDFKAAALNAADIADPSAPSAGNSRLYAINGQWRAKDAVSAREDVSFADLGGTSNFSPANGQVIKRKIRLNTSSASTVTVDSFTLPDNSIVQAEAWLRARDRTTNDSAWYVVRAGAKRNGGGAAALVGAMAFSSSGEDDSAWGPVLDVSGNDLRLRFVGDGTNIVDVEAHWVIHVSAL